ncbi:MAG: hypothetical protein M3R48_02340, partial [Candidatus Dormibacteraeota bacterium]|nr:hypothetical protein [Candidatus Dormibacteraeota bacterium]
MTVVGVVAAGWVEACGLLLVIGCALAAVAVILGAGLPATSWHGLASRGLFDRERDMAANLGWRWRNWVAVRLALVGAGVGVGVATRIWVLVVIGSLLGSLGFRFALAGRAAGRRLRMERAFLARLRDLRDRIAIG